MIVFSFDWFLQIQILRFMYNEKWWLQSYVCAITSLESAVFMPSANAAYGRRENLSER